MQYWYAPFLADTERLRQTIAIDLARGDNQVRDRLRLDDRTQVSHSTSNGYTIHSPALQPGIIVEKANRAEPEERVLQQFAQDKLPATSSAVDERCLAS